MARIDPPTRRTLGVRLASAAARRMFGQALEPGLVTAHHRGVFWANLLSEVVGMRSRHHLPERLRSLVEHRASIVIGCPWCIDFGAMLALRQGMTADEILAVPDYAGSPLFTDLEKRAMAYADAATATPMEVTDEMVAALRADLGDPGLVELVHLVALENHRSRTNHALGVTSQGFTDSDVCALPVNAAQARAAQPADDAPVQVSASEPARA